MHLAMGLAQTCRLDISGGITESIFPHAERLLNDDADHWNAFRFVASKKKQDSYRSVMDFFFCEIAAGPWRNRAQAFYEGHGRPAREWLSDEEKAHWDRVLVCALKVAINLHKEERRQTWTEYRLMSLRAAA